MNLLQAIILSFIQGLTEFLPVSSSGHLALFGKLLGLKKPDIAFDVVIHVATLFAIVIYYRQDIFKILKNLFLFNKIEKKDNSFENNPLKFMLFGIVASIPTAIIGLGLKDKVEKFHENLNIVGACFLVTAIFLFIATMVQKKGKSNRLLTYSLWLPFLIGIAQGIAILPGISRSGATITTALLFGVCASDSAEFSFLLSIPAILGAFILELKGISASFFTSNFVVGFFVALVVGFFSIRVVEYLVKKMKLSYFSYYLILLAVLSFYLG